jgi:hypothetical protein
MWGRSVVTEGGRITVLRGICGPRTARNGSTLHTAEVLNVHPASNKDRLHTLQSTVYIWVLSVRVPSQVLPHRNHNSNLWPPTGHSLGASSGLHAGYFKALHLQPSMPRKLIYWPKVILIRRSHQWGWVGVGCSTHERHNKCIENFDRNTWREDTASERHRRILQANNT